MTTMPEQDEWTFMRVVRATLTLVLVALGFWLFYRFNHVIFLLFTAIILGTVLRPVVAWLVRRRFSRPLAVLVVYLALLALIVGFVFLLIPLVSTQGRTIAGTLPDYYQTLRQWLLNHQVPLLARLGQALPMKRMGVAPVEATEEEVLASAGQALQLVYSTAKTVFITLVVLLLAFHWTLVGPRTIQAILLWVPMDRREGVADLISDMETKVSAFMAGQGLLCLVIAGMALVAYLAIGLPNAIPLALVAGAMEAVPMVGPLLGAIPAGIVALSAGPVKLLWLVVATVVIQQLENNLLVPRVMSKAVGVNPFVSILAILAFSTFFGLAGAFMAIPIAAIIQLLLDRFVFERGPSGSEVPDGRDYASRLRYEAQDLAQGLRKQARVTQEGSNLTVEQIDQVMDEMEAIATELDGALAQARPAGAP